MLLWACLEHCPKHHTVPHFGRRSCGTRFGRRTLGAVRRRGLSSKLTHSTFIYLQQANVFVANPENVQTMKTNERGPSDLDPVAAVTSQSKFAKRRPQLKLSFDSRPPAERSFLRKLQGSRASRSLAVYAIPCARPADPCRVSIVGRPVPLRTSTGQPVPRFDLQ
jgi:hypothetical protein